MNGWIRLPLSQLASRISDGSHNPPKGVEMSEFLMLSAKNVFDGQLSFDTPRYLSATDFMAEHRRTNIAAGDVLLTIVGTIGRTAVVPADTPTFTLQRSVAVIKPDTSVIDPRFLMFALMSGSELLNSQARGVAQKGIYLEALRAFSINHPALLQQRRIVAILDEAFEGIATAKANAEKNLQNARAIFDARLQYIYFTNRTETVETTLGAVYDVRDGTHDSPKYHDKGFPLITSKNLKRDGLDFDNVRFISEVDYKKINTRSAVHRGDVLFAMIGTIGNPTVVEIDPQFSIKNVALFKVANGQSGHFLRYYLSSQMVIEKMRKDAKGTTQKFVGLGYLREFPIALPPAAAQSDIVAELDGLLGHTDRLEEIYTQKIAALDELKKSLLHQAFSGRL